MVLAPSIIRTIRENIERSTEFEFSLCVVFVDYKKASDFVLLLAVTDALKEV